MTEGLRDVLCSAIGSVIMQMLISLVRNMRADMFDSRRYRELVD